MSMDWADVSRRLSSSLCMKCDPVGILLHPGEGEGIGIDAGKTTVCHMLLRSRMDRENGILSSDAPSMLCLWGASALGLMRTPPRLKDGLLYLGFVSDPIAGAKLHERMGMLGDAGRQYRGLCTFPLDMAPADPDAVVLYVTPGRALRLIIAALNLEGGSLDTPMTGQASVCASIARAVGKGSISVDIPCVGDRRIGLVGDDELVVVIPAASMDSLMTGLERTDFVAPYPYRPQTGWVPDLPPMFAPRPEEMD